MNQKALQFWIHLDCYPGMNVPTLSNGWLDTFKNRHGIKEIAGREEAGSINEVEIAKQLDQA